MADPIKKIHIDTTSHHDISFEKDHLLMLASELRLMAHAKGAYVDSHKNTSPWTQGILINAASIIEWCASNHSQHSNHE